MISEPVRERGRVGRRRGRRGSLLEFSSLLDEVVGEGDENSVSVEVVDSELVKHGLLRGSIGSGFGFELRKERERERALVRCVEAGEEPRTKAHLVVVDGLPEVLNSIEMIDGCRRHGAG